MAVVRARRKKDKRDVEVREMARAVAALIAGVPIPCPSSNLPSSFSIAVPRVSARERILRISLFRMAAHCTAVLRAAEV